MLCRVSSSAKAVAHFLPAAAALVGPAYQQLQAGSGRSEVQVGRRVAADQLVEQRLGVYCIIRIDVTLSRTRFGNAAQLDEF
jgi:hypothetical protein